MPATRDHTLREIKQGYREIPWNQREGLRLPQVLNRLRFRVADGLQGRVALPPHVGFVFKWIHKAYAELAKIAHVPGRDRQPMHYGRCCDHGILDQSVRTAMLETRPFSECGCIHWKDVMGDQHRVEPRFQLLSLGDILLAGEFDACLDLPDRHRRQKQFIGSHMFNPPHDGWMRMKTAQFRYDIGVKQVHGLTRSAETRGVDASDVAVSAHPCARPERATVP